jgi:hypothetical protein
VAIQRITGSFVTSTTAGETVRAFVPSPLPPEPPLDLTPLLPLLDRANQAGGPYSPSFGECGDAETITPRAPDLALSLPERPIPGQLNTSPVIANNMSFPILRDV